MKRPLLMLFCAVALSAASPVANASADIRIWHRHHKDAAKNVATSQPKAKSKAKKSIFHRAQPTREQAAKTEIAYGMTGPKSVGGRHPQPGPAGYGAK